MIKNEEFMIGYFSVMFVEGSVEKRPITSQRMKSLFEEYNYISSNHLV